MIQKSILTILVSVLIFSAMGSFANAQELKETKTILILFGLSPAQPAYIPILDGIRQQLENEYGDTYDLRTEYLEVESYPGNNYPEKRFHIYNEKYRDTNIDLLIVVGRNAIGVIRNNAENYLLNLPTISVDFDLSEYGYPSDIKLNEQTAVLAMKINIGKMVSTSLSVFPSTSSIYFIGGTTVFDRFMMSIAKKTKEKIDTSNKKIEFISDVSMDSILHKVNRLPNGSIIFIPSFNTDSKLVTYYNSEAVRLISRNANSPVFAYSDMGFGDGSVGGYLLSFRKIGLVTGETAVKILKGTNPGSIKYTEDDSYETVFDWRELKRWDLENSDLIPKESTIIYQEINYFEKYKWIGGVILLFLVLQTILIVNLVRLNRNQKVITQKIIETENKYRDFLREDRMLRMGQLTASLSHELNQPLTAILSNAQAGINFINSNEATPDLLKQILQRIVDNDKRGASILSSIRGMLKLEQRDKEKTNLNSIIEEVVDVFRSEARKMFTKLFVQILNEPVYVLADRTQIQQVLLNFIFNASQSMERSRADNKTIDIIQTINSDAVVVSVRDYGKGIDESIKETIFKPFITSKSEGMGIGLSICRSIIEDHQGKIWAENKPDGGAEFSFSLNIFKDE